jgi:hypothetical protein
MNAYEAIENITTVPAIKAEDALPHMRKASEMASAMVTEIEQFDVFRCLCDILAAYWDLLIYQPSGGAHATKRWFNRFHLQSGRDYLPAG